MSVSRRARLVLFTTVALLGIAAVVYFTADPSKTGPVIGKLARPHAHLEGEQHCIKCHVTGKLVKKELCLECHKPLAARIAGKKGFHGRPQVLALKCEKCHDEHNGLDYEQIRWPNTATPFEPGVATAAKKPADFPHLEGTTFALEGAHEKLKCDDCHRLSLLVDAEVADFKKDAHTYLGTSSSCVGCHQDPHQPTLGNDCAKCHDAKLWDPAPTFDHADTQFALEGKHADAKCEKCHLVDPPREAPPLPAKPLPSFEFVVADKNPRPFRGVGFGLPEASPVKGSAQPSCLTCHSHENPHPDTAAFLDCTQCHTAHDWKQAEGAPFDHDDTSFKLLDKHLTEASCQDCHGEKIDDFSKTSCADCHSEKYDGYHGGSFDREMLVAKQSCEMCHDAASWEESTYAKTSHPESVPLTRGEGHDKRCEVCHAQDAREFLKSPEKESFVRAQLTGAGAFPRLPAPAGHPLGPLETSCMSCHQDIHKGKLGEDCASCHGFQTFHTFKQDSGFDSVKLHAEVGFPLLGEHLKAECQDCHGGKTPSGALRQLALKEVHVKGRECVVCHKEDDPHQGQLSQDCKSCHDEFRWAPSKFDIARHTKTRLALEGAHLAVACELCHERELEVPPEQAERFTQKAQRFKWNTRTTCNGCHQEDDVHQGQFRGQDCGACHDTTDFTSSSFDALAHSRVGFPLEGPHDTDCSKCHVSGLRHGKAVTYAGTPAGCASCHQDIHAGQFARRQGGCQGCHRVQAWKPTTFNHDACRYPLRGKHKVVKCSGCHLSQTRKTAKGPLRVVHYFPIEKRDCDDCHVNPHTTAAGEEGK